MNDMWDWPYILYVGRVWLQYTDQEIWELTPKQYKAQWDVHVDIQRQMHSTSTRSSKSSNIPTGFIDQLSGW